MKKQLLFYAGLLMVILEACNSSEKPAELKVVTNTITKTDTVTVATQVDSAAIVAFYAALEKNRKLLLIQALNQRAPKKLLFTLIQLTQQQTS